MLVRQRLDTFLGGYTQAPQSVLCACVGAVCQTEVNSFFRTVITFLYQSKCTLCGCSVNCERGVCDVCFASLTPVGEACPICAAPSFTLSCASCQRHRPSFDRALAGYRYGGGIRYLVQQTKFRSDRYACRQLAAMSLNIITAQCGFRRPELLIPVPLHSDRLARRGFNQAHEIAIVFARHMDLPINAWCCQRAIATPPQSLLSSPTERRRNVRGAFVVLDVNAVARRHITIVDDVMTSGATVETLATTLRQAGAASIDVWVCARANMRP